MIFKKIIIIFTICLVFSLCACTASDVEQNVQEQAIIPEYTLPPVEKEPVPKKGGDLTFPIPQNPATLNPLKITNVELYNLFTLIYEKPISTDVVTKSSRFISNAASSVT